MSKSLKRVKADLERLGLPLDVRRMDATTRSAEEAALAVGVEVNQIVKSLVLRAPDSDIAHLFLTAGGNRVDLAKAADCAGSPLEKADAAFIRARTGFAIGGVSPFAHLHPPRVFLDRDLLDYPIVWAAAGTPFDVFPINPRELVQLTDAEISDFVEKA